jgi:putative nucleotidyltransferase with HDIG domain
MPINRCPGQDQRFWKPGDIFEARCPHCGASIEFWKDEPRATCKGCGKVVPNPKFDMGCAEWCRYAEACLGASAVAAVNAGTVRDQVVAEMKAVFGDDRRRIAHALEVLRIAEEIAASEGGDPLIVKAAAVLHDIGIHEAERKHGSAAGKYQEIEGPPIARRILEKLGLAEAVIEHVCRIVGSHHSARDIDTPEFRAVWDADRLVNFGEECPAADVEARRRHIEKVFRTAAGKALALDRFGKARG